jgi:hypothetical protein
MSDKIIFVSSKRAQMKLSFGMIFSIILIVIFIAFAFYAILKFLDLQDSVKISQFTDNLQDDINKMWKGSQGEREVDYSLPTKITSICFKDDEYENLVFRSDKFVEGNKIDHINIEKTLAGKDSFCIDNINGKLKMIIKKEYGDALVTIIKNE